MKVIVVFDIGRTNKKYILFNEDFHIVEEYSENLPEVTDEDGFVCDDIVLITEWVRKHWSSIKSNKDYEVTAVNASAYGASLVHLDELNRPLTPLYSYLKPLPKEYAEKFYNDYGDAERLSLETGSPSMGMLNSGKQLYWLKYAQPEVFKKIRTSLHFPQYIMFLLTGRKVSDYTSLGCHTALWSFEMMNYHGWVKSEGLQKLMAPLIASSSFILREGDTVIRSGFGLHDSSAALIPYRTSFKKPFILLSTGTWCINFNPFLTKPLTTEQLNRDCLHYMTPEGSGVKASRVFLGKEHDHQVARLADHFHLHPEYFQTVEFDEQYLDVEGPPYQPALLGNFGKVDAVELPEWHVRAFSSPDVAYHHLMHGLVEILGDALSLIEVESTETLFVDGGFARNEIFTQLLARKYPRIKVMRTELPHATAFGAALHVVRPQDFEFPGELRQVIPGQSMPGSVHF